MVNKNIDLPSQRSALLNEIEKPLRRGFREKRNMGTVILFAVLILEMLLLAFLASWAFNSISPNQASAKEAVVLVDGNPSLTSFCNQTVKDHDSYGRDLSESLKDYCGINK